MGKLADAIGAVVAAYRDQIGWSQRELADHTDLDQAQIWRIENGKGWIQEDQLEKICKVFGIEPEQLFAMANKNSLTNRIAKNITPADLLQGINRILEPSGLIIKKRTTPKDKLDDVKS